MKTVFAYRKRLTARISRLTGAVRYRGNARFCPLCGSSSSKFLPFGTPQRLDARCFHCGSLERHRFLWAYLQRQTDFFSSPPKSLLHFAPEPSIEDRLRAIVGDHYVTADIEPGKAMVQVDITEIHFPENYFECILCSHVLEHVADDALAMRELRRVLKPEGYALLMVPVFGDTTREDAAITDPKLRRQLFGQEDHVRIYGKDFVERLKMSGFAVECISPENIFGNDEMIRLGIPPLGGDIYRVNSA